jgi:hypothetical protein
MAMYRENDKEFDKLYQQMHRYQDRILEHKYSILNCKLKIAKIQDQLFVLRLNERDRKIAELSKK